MGKEPLWRRREIRDYVKKSIYMRIGSLIRGGLLLCYVALVGFYTPYDMVINIHV